VHIISVAFFVFNLVREACGMVRKKVLTGEQIAIIDAGNKATDEET